MDNSSDGKELRNVHNIIVLESEIRVVEKYDFDGNDDGLPWNEVSIPSVFLVSTMIEIRTALTSKRCQELQKMFPEGRTSASDLCLFGELDCESKELEELLKILKIRRIDSNIFVPQRYFNSSYMKMKMERLFLGNCGMNDDQMLQMKAVSLHFSSLEISDKGLNLIFKQWLSGEREIDSLIVRSNRKREIGEIFDGICGNPVWTPELHNQSIIGGISLEEIPDEERFPIYSIWKSSAIDDPRHVRISDTSVEIRSILETDFLQTMLRFDQLYKALGYCILCDAKNCEHRLLQ